MKRLVRFLERIANISGRFFGWLVLVMMLLIFFEVFMRYVVGRPPGVSDEFSAYMLVALCFLGAGYTFKEKGHVRITALVSRLPPRVASWLRLITLVFAFAFTLALCQASYAFMALSFKLHMASSSWIRFPLQGPQMTVVIGFAILALVLIAEIARAIMNIRAGISVEGKSSR